MYRRRGWHGRSGRIERFQVAALLLLLREHPAHGYDLLERLPSVLGDERIDVGNLYRVLRSLEEQGLVSSEWDESVPGPAKRTYEPRGNAQPNRPLSPATSGARFTWLPLGIFAGRGGLLPVSPLAQQEERR